MNKVIESVYDLGYNFKYLCNETNKEIDLDIIDIELHEYDSKYYFIYTLRTKDDKYYNANELEILNQDITDIELEYWDKNNKKEIKE